MAKKRKPIGPVGWFVRSFAAGFGAVGGAMLAAALGGAVLGGVVTTDWQLPAVTFSHVVPAQVVPAPTFTPELSYPAERTASAAPIGYPASRYPMVIPPSISRDAAGEDERPPEPNTALELELR